MIHPPPTLTPKNQLIWWFFFTWGDDEEDIANTSDNIDIEDYDLSKAFFRKFYSEHTHTLSLWNLYINCGVIDEKNIDIEAYERQNLIKFLNNRGFFALLQQSPHFVANQFLIFMSILLLAFMMCGLPIWTHICSRSILSLMLSLMSSIKFHPIMKKDCYLKFMRLLLFSQMG